MLMNLLAFADHRPSNTNNTFEQYPNLAYNQDKSGQWIRPSPTKPFRGKEVARAPTDRSQTFRPIWLLAPENIQGKVQRLAHKRRWPPDFLRFMDIPLSASRRLWFLELRTQ